ncbi:MAG: hypothetical protein HFG41_02690 [Coprococcus sp.]|nr:hypothetical protein [Coprococcus sp.]
MLGLSAALLLGSAVGSTQAALTFYSENYTAEIKISQIGVTLVENGKDVSCRNYNGDKWQEETNRDGDSVYGELLADMVPEGSKLALNKTYNEDLKVRNSGSIDEYVRVRIYKYWRDPAGNKVTTLSPDLIDLNLVNQGQWIQGSATPECTELYHKGILTAGTESAPFADTIRIDGEIASAVEIKTEGNKITTTYKYDGVTFHVDVEVDAVQTHNAEDAMKSAWGVDAAALGIL